MDSIIVKSFLPEIFLSLSVLLQLLFNVRVINNLKFNYPVLDKETLVQTVFILFCLLFLFFNLKIEVFFTNFLFLNNEGSRLIKILIVLSSLSALLLIFRSFVIQKLNFFEFFSLLLLAIFSLLLLASVYDLMSAYLCIEMQALCFYILASFRRNSAVSTEAGLKYFISGAFISCLFLFGVSLIYGSLGTVNFNALSLLLSFPLEEEVSTGLNFFIIVGCLLIIVTLLFKVAAAPFHFWSPDVYEGAPLSSTIVFVIIPKVVLFSLLIKWILTISNVFFEIKDIFLFSGVFSVFIGTFFSLQQKRIKRLIIYSSIAQVGFLILALTENSISGFSSVFFFLIIYIVTSILVWGHFSVLYACENQVSMFYKRPLVSLFLSSLSNLFERNKVWSSSFLIVFFSIAGIPPLCGFLAKVLIIYGLVENSQIFTSILLVLISVISVFYYIRVLKIIFFEISVKQSSALSLLKSDFFFNTECLLFVLSIFFLIFFFFNPTLLLLFSQYIALCLIGI